MQYVMLSLSLINFLLGIFVFKRTEKNQQSYAFLAFATSISVWIFCNFLLRISPSLSLIRASYSLGIVVATVALIWTLFFLKKNIPNAIKFILIPTSVIFSIATFSTNAVVLSLSSISTWGYKGDVGQFFPLYSIYFSVIVVLIVANLVLSYRDKDTKIPKQQIQVILFGLFIFAATSFLVSFVLPSFFHTLEYTAIDNFSSSFFLVAIAYAILKYKLFNLKVILVELAILLLNMFLLFNVFTSHATTDLILNVSVSAFVFLFSVVLMRGIYKDIRDRERIEGLVKEMEIANERLRMLEGQKTEFVSIASHQLRTPLTVIKGYASMVLEGTFGAISDSVRDAMDKLYKSSERIVALVEDLLTVSRIEQGRMMLVFETINLKDLVQSVLEETQAGAAEAKIDFSFTAEEGKEFFVAVDEKKFKQVVRHILDNAIKYTPAPGSVHVTVADDSLTKKVRLTISDTGLGMTQEQITAIFERFNLKVGEGQLTTDKEHLGQGDQTQTHRGPTLNTAQIHEGRTSDVGKEIHEDPTVGSGAGDSRSEESKAMGDNRTPGIGLYIAQEIIEAHHGTIRIESAGPDRGTTVVVELPRAERK